MDGKRALAEKFSDVAMFRSCEQCGCCSSACPVTGVNLFNVRRIVRHIELDLPEEVSKTGLPWACTTCGRCETVCPNGIAILDIIRLLRAMTPETMVPDEAPPCAAACPAGIDVPGYLRWIARGKPEEAYKVILEKVPFPGVLGRVCMHPCETKCRRKEVNQPVAICALKRYAADKGGDLFKAALQIREETGRRAAVIGSGPAGLSAAFYLRKKGHEVTVFEARPKPGGMMRYGIPCYRLPEGVLDKEIRQVLSAGIKLETGKKLGRDITLDQLKRDGYEAVFIATGLQESRRIELEGSDLEGVLWGVDFLFEVSEGKKDMLNGRVLVVGGGNVAVDVALTALRIGAEEVSVACLENREEMPASPWEIEQALEEGIKLLPSWGPHRIVGENGKVKSIELVTCTCVFDEKGTFRPAFGEEKKTLEADHVILAVGQSADLSFLSGEEKIKTERGLIVINRETHETGMPGVFAGGDAGDGAGTIINAVAAGRKAAGSMDRLLGGDGIIDDRFAEKVDAVSYTGKRDRGFADLTRNSAPTLCLEERLGSFKEVNLRFSDEQALSEAGRCLQCDFEIKLAGRLRLSER
ncbi:MAG: FAD-dependent oxidoreductase [Deltaproteobacteria bacterium]|nr:FAD-dependent oxidoreductase [Deltaproteobacteria bacterium]